MSEIRKASFALGVATGALVLLGLVSVWASAQSPDPACVAAFRVNADSLAKVHLPSTRLTAYQVRARARLDTLARQHCPVAVVTPTPTPTPTPVPQPVPTPTDTSAVGRLLGPWLSSAATSALGGVHARYESDFVRFDDPQWNFCHSAQNTKPLYDCLNYYDRAAIYYVWAKRDPARAPLYLMRGDSIVRHFRRLIINGNYQIVEHWALMDGIGVHALMRGDTLSRNTVGRIATRLAWYLNPSSAGYVRVASQQDNRIQAYLLRALLTAHQLNAPSPQNPTLTQGLPGGYDWPTTLRAALTAILGTRDADGQWRGAKCGTAGRATHPFTIGLLHDALIRYYELFERDPRIPAAIQQSAELLWANDWLPASNAFKYVGISCPGEGGPTPAADLNGLLVNGFAWLGQQQNSQTWRDRAALIFAGAVSSGAAGTSAKHYNQLYSLSYRALAWW